MSTNQPGIVNPKKIKAKYKKGYHAKNPENVYAVDKSPITVAPGETVEILIECKKGFSVMIPYAGFFGGNFFEATEQPPWAPPPSSGGEKWWGVRLVRTMLKNPHANKEMAYCIYSKDLDNFAVANSPPRMGLKP